MNSQKLLLLFILLTVAVKVKSQEYNGNYTSNETSFKHSSNEKLNFKEESIFNISITINENDGYIICQDQRIPDKLLIYKITKKEIILVEGVSIYKNCINEHLGDNTNSTLTLYLDKENHLNLLVSNSESSQVFKNLQKK